MDNLFIARHAQYGRDHRISEEGCTQMRFLGDEVKKIINGGSIYLISSTAPRALDSSEELIRNFGLPNFEKIPYLWSGNDAPRDSYYWNMDNNKLMDIINSKAEKADNLLVVTHLEVVENFPKYFVNKAFGLEGFIPSPSKGQAIHLDLKGKSYRILP